MVLRLVLHAWQTEGRALPTSDIELRSIARAHLSTWKTHRAAIMRVLDAVLPDLDRARAHRFARRQNLVLASNAASAARKRARMAQSHAASAESVPVFALGYLPKREPPKPPRLASTGRMQRRLTD